MNGVIIVLDEDLFLLTRADLWDGLGNEMNSGEDARVTANCAYLVVIVISVTRPDVLLSREAVVRKHIFFIHPTLLIAIMLSLIRVVFVTQNAY